MSSFSERFGYSSPLRDLADDEMPDELSNGLWDVIFYEFCSDIAETNILEAITGYRHHFDIYSRAVWTHIFKKSIDTRPSNPFNALSKIREHFFKGPFNIKYDLLEFSALQTTDGIRFAHHANFFLERERAAFRFSGMELVRVSSKEELTAVTEAHTISPSQAVRTHIETAARLYSDRETPDFRNSIKESISAVEAAVCYVSGERPDGVSKNLKKALDENVLHPALRQGFEKLFAYSSDESGIRHALLEDGRKVSLEDARFMLVACSAFANYLIALKSKGN